MDTGEGSQNRIYLAAPLFSESERAFNLKIRDLLAIDGYSVYLPQEAGEGHGERGKDETIFRSHVSALEDADFVVAVCDGADTDSGTAWEMGYARAKGIPVIALRTDTRCKGAGRRVNLMLQESSIVVGEVGEILPALRSFHA